MYDRMPASSKPLSYPERMAHSQPLRPYNSVPAVSATPYGQPLGGPGYQWQSFSQDNEALRDPYRSSEQVEKDLQELVAQTFADTETDVDMTMNIVDGFRDEIRLLPHQVVGRAWMTERETDKKRGGILADDMGLALKLFFSFNSINLRVLQSRKDDTDSDKNCRRASYERR